MDNFYRDERYCDNCRKDTLQIVSDSTHERDSSGDYAVCLECHRNYRGLHGKWRELVDTTENLKIH